MAVLLLLLVFTVFAPARAKEPLWGEVASTLGKGFLNVTSDGVLRQSKPYRHHGGPVSVTVERMDAGIAAEYGLAPDLDLHLRLPYIPQTVDARLLRKGGEPCC